MQKPARYCTRRRSPSNYSILSKPAASTLILNERGSFHPTTWVRDPNRLRERQNHSGRTGYQNELHGQVRSIDNC